MGKGKQDSNDYNGIVAFALYFIVASVIIFVIVTFHFLAGGNVQAGYSNFATALSGLTLPLIGVGAALITYLAFRMQFDANKQIKEQFRLQQFETQFFELLRLHKENVNEMVIQGYVFENRKKIEREISGRKIFVSNIQELDSLICIICKFELHRLRKKRIRKDKFKEIIPLAYEMFFYGLDSIEKKSKQSIHPVTNKVMGKKEKARLLKLIRFIREFRNNHFRNGDKKLAKSNLRISTSNVKLNFNYKPFSGHLSRYGHYYRNLMLIVKHVVDNKIGLTYEEERNYLRILRAQLTSHEQFLLFLNWYSESGSKWEENSKDGNKFFTDYRMIHNITVDTVVENCYIKWKDLISEEFKSRLDFRYLNDHDKELFEAIGGVKSSQYKETK